MRRIILTHSFFSLVLLPILVVMGGCGKSGSSSSPSTSNPIATIEVTPGAATVVKNGFQRFGATARDAQGSPISGVSFAWSSSDPSVATVDSNGLAAGMAEGRVAITAAAGSVVGSAQLQINLTAVSSIDLFPSTATVEAGQSQQFAAVAKDSLGHQIAGVLFSWSTSDAAVATITSDGLLTGRGPGTATVTAAAGSVNQSASIQVASSGSPNLGSLPVASIEIFPSSASIYKGTTQHFAGVAKDAAGKQISGVALVWQTGSSQIATIDATGLAAGVSGGVTTVTVSGGGVTSGAASLTVRLFNDPVYYAVGKTPQSVAVGDFDDDGIADLAVANYDGNDLSILKGLGGGDFAQPPQTLSTGAFPESVVSGRFVVNSPFDDLAVADFGADLLSIFLGSSGGAGPVAGAPLQGGSGPIDVIAADFNKDSKNDLAAADVTSGKISILLGKGDGTFGIPTDIFLNGQSPIALTSADLNNDGNVDLVVVLGTSTNVGILLGNGDGSFQALQSAPVGPNPISVVSGDFNGDGKIDLAVVNSGNATATLLFGDGTGAFPTTGALSLSGGGHPVFIATGDFNGDGKQDLAVADDARDVVSIFLNGGSGTFSPQIDHPTGSKPASIAVRDFNGDGNADLAVANAQTNTLSIFLRVP